MSRSERHREALLQGEAPGLVMGALGCGEALGLGNFRATSCQPFIRGAVQPL